MSGKPFAALNRCALAACVLLLASIAVIGWDAPSPQAGRGRLLASALLCVCLAAVIAIAVIAARMRSLKARPLAGAAATPLVPESTASFDKEYSPHVFLLDQHGVIVGLNEALLVFSGMDTCSMNYLEVCDASASRGEEEAVRFAAGIRAVLSRQISQFSGDYLCRTPTRDHWYRATISRVLHSDPPRFLVVHENTTRHRAMENALRQSALSIRELAGHQEAVREEERKRIAQEIHDDLGQQLLALRIDVSILQSRQVSNPAIVSQLDTMQATIGKLVQSVRAIINDLRPAVLDLGLYAAAEWQLNDFTQKTGISSKLLSDFQDIALPDSHATALFRVLQESLTNVSRHAEATHVDVRLQLKNGTLVMEISDNGKGMPLESKKPGSFGLRGMRERIDSLGGELEINSAPECGVTVCAAVPVQTAPDAEPPREGYVHRSPVDRRASRRFG
jgi:signal transduction histidine kinase